jgi:hypothetical protein
MSEREIEQKRIDPQERDLLVAYLSYALDDVEAISRAGLHHLRMAISSIAQDPVADFDALGAPGHHHRTN